MFCFCFFSKELSNLCRAGIYGIYVSSARTRKSGIVIFLLALLNHSVCNVLFSLQTRLKSFFHNAIKSCRIQFCCVKYNLPSHSEQLQNTFSIASLLQPTFVNCDLLVHPLGIIHLYRGHHLIHVGRFSGYVKFFFCFPFLSLLDKMKTACVQRYGSVWYLTW